MLQPTGLTIINLRLKPQISSGELERLQAALKEKLNTSPRGLLIDCHEINTVEVDTLAMLHNLKSFAESEGKRLAFCRVSSGLRSLLRKHARTFHFDLFGEGEITEEPEPKPREEPRPKPNYWPQVKRIGLVVGCLLPIVVATEYYVMFYGIEPTTAVAIKTFEDRHHAERFRIFGTVEAVQNGRRLPDSGATVMIWLADAPENAQNAWVTFVDESGHYDLALPFEAASEQLMVNIAIISDSLAGTTSRDDRTQPAKPIPEISHPSRQSNVFQHLIRESQPLRVNALFF